MQCKKQRNVKHTVCEFGLEELGGSLEAMIDVLDAGIGETVLTIVTGIALAVTVETCYAAIHVILHCSPSTLSLKGLCLMESTMA